MASRWFLYCVRCADGSIYTGITTDVKRRVTEHNESKKKASKYVWAKRPCYLLFSFPCIDKEHAAFLEREIKKLSHYEKELIALDPAKLQEFRTPR